MSERVYILRDQAVKNRFKAFVDSLPNEKLWEVAVRPHKDKRSLEQNALLHTVLREIALETDNSEHGIKEFFKEQFGPKEIVMIGGQERLVSRSTASYNVQEMADFITRCQAWAASELGVFT